MTGCSLLRGPLGLDPDYLYPDMACRKVLVVVHTVVAANRLLDVVPVLESDFRVQVFFTRPPDVFGGGVDRLLHTIDGLVVPWEQAVQTKFALAVAADHGHLQELHAPLVVISHGGDRNKYAVQRPGENRSTRTVFGLGPQWLVWDGAVFPSAVVLSHDKHRRILAQVCPEALPVAVVAGDPCFDRMVASLSAREAYRRALGVPEGRKLVVLTSTWGQRGLLASCQGLPARVMAELDPREYRVVAVLHPLIWHWHGPWQVRAWLAACRRAGLGLIPPEQGWQAALLAADIVVGDYGSVTVYGAAMGAPTVLASFPDEDVHPESAGALLGATLPRLGTQGSLVGCFKEAERACTPEFAAAVRRHLTSVPGRSTALLRELFYRLMDLPEPGEPALTEPLAPPRLL